MTTDIILAGGKRTPFGDFGKSLRDIPLARLGVHATKACLEAAKLDPKHVDHLAWGNVLPVDQEGYLAARYIAIEAGLPVESAALNVSRACGSGSQAIVSAAEQILSGHGKIAVAGGGENFSRAPYAVTTARWGHKRGPQTMVDMLDWAYRDPFSLQMMGEIAENLAEDHQIARAPMDEWAVMSQKRAGAAIASGFLAKQIAPSTRERYQGQDRELYDQVFDTAERFAVSEFATHNRAADLDEPKLVNGRVVILPAVKKALDDFAAAGFLAAHHDASLDGAQLPWAVVQGAFSFFQAANIATVAYPFLTIAAANLLDRFASNE